MRFFTVPLYSVLIGFTVNLKSTIYPSGLVVLHNTQSFLMFLIINNHFYRLSSTTMTSFSVTSYNCQLATKAKCRSTCLYQTLNYLVKTSSVFLCHNRSHEQITDALIFGIYIIHYCFRFYLPFFLILREIHLANWISLVITSDLPQKCSAKINNY